MKKLPSAYKIGLIYIISGILWIISSNLLLNGYYTLKGIFFVLLSSILIFFLVKNSLKRLRQKQHELGMILKALPLPALIIRDHHIEMLNNLFTKTFGYHHIDTVQELLSKLFATEQEQIEMRKQFRLLSDTPDDQENVLECTILDHNGNQREIQCHHMPSKQYNIFIVTDLTEIRKISLKNQQAEKLQALEQLSGGVAHDFNNQLMPIMGFAELIEGNSTDKCIQNFARKIIKNAHNAASLSRQLLTFSRRDTVHQSPSHPEIF